MRFATFNAGLLDIRFAGRTIFEFTPHTRKRAPLVAAQLAGLANDVDVICLINTGLQLNHFHGLSTLG
jgi:hypothetical protein